MNGFVDDGPPEHVEGTVHVTKDDAGASKEHFDGKTTEQAAASPSA